MTNLKKIFLTFTSILILYLFSPLKVANAIFTRYTQNPLKVNFDSSLQFTETYQAHIIIENNNIIGLFASQGPNTKSQIVKSYSKNGIEWFVTNSIYQNNNDLYAPRIFTLNKFQKLVTFTERDNQYGLILRSIICDNNFVCNIESLKTILRKDWISWKVLATASGFIVSSNNYYFLFYTGDTGAGWKIGMAYSTDLEHWTDCPNNPIFPSGDGVSIIEKDGVHYLFYHESTPGDVAIKYRTSTDPFSCTMRWSSPQVALQAQEPYEIMMTAPSVLIKDGITYLYYTGFDGSSFNINLATDPPLPPPFSPSEKPVIIIPGLMASWNKDAIIYNKTVSQSDWKLSPFATEYQGIINTLKNIGYKENENLYLFNYDWRKTVNKTAIDLDSFINSKIPSGKKVSLIGHSLGGLVSRSYIHEFGSEKINNIITVGTPHEGAAQAYPAFAGGMIEKNNYILWLSQKLLLLLNKDYLLQTDREIIQKQLPVLQNLLPIYNFLKKSDGSFVQAKSMKYQNDLLNLYKPRLSELSNILYTFGGNNISTPFGYNVKEPSLANRLLGNFPDGEPTSIIYDEGDGIILISSSVNLNPAKLSKKNHGEIIYQKESIKKILSTLNIPFSENNIVEGKPTKITPGLILIMRSPAEMKLECGEKSYFEQENIIFVENPPIENCTLFVTGKKQGIYNIIIGQLGINQDDWSQITGEIINSIPSTQIDEYKLNIDINNPVNPLSIEILFDQLEKKIKKINYPNKQILLSALKDSKNAYSEKNYFLSQSLLLNVQNLLGSLINNDNQIKNIFESLDLLETIFEKIPSKNNKSTINISSIKKQADYLNNILAKLSKKPSDYQKLLIEKITQKIDSIQKSYNNSKFQLAKVQYQSLLLFYQALIKTI